MDEWKWIPGWEGLYQAHPCGQVRSVDRKVEDRNGKRVRLKKGCILKAQINGNGFHYHVGLAREGITIICHIHALIALTFIGPRPPGQEVRHLNCNGFDNRLQNVVYGTRSQNREDSIRAGTIARGERHGQSKLTDDQVCQIRRESGSGSAVAQKYGVTRRTIDRIRSGEAWCFEGQPDMTGHA